MINARVLLDEQHFAIGGQRPEVVGDDRFQFIGQHTYGEHRGENLILGVLGMCESIALAGVLRHMNESGDFLL